LAGNLLMFFLFIIGVLSLRQMKTTFFPEVESRFISIRAIYPGSSPEEIEEGVITKIEEGLKGITGLERVTSTSQENTGNVSVEVAKGYDTDLVLQDVKNALDRINSFPANMEPLVVYKLENLGRAVVFAVNGQVDLQTLKSYARKIEDELLATEGISKVTLSGFPAEEIEITFREADLRKYNLSFAEAAAAIRNFNIEITGGTIKTDQEELLIRANNKQYFGKDLADIQLRTSAQGGIVYLYQVANIRDKWEDQPQRTFINRQPGVVIEVQNTLQEDMLTIAAKVRDYIENFNAKNKDVQLTIIEDSSVTLQQRIDLLTENGIIGFFLVLIFLAMFLNYRLAFWVALSIPISFAGMFIICNLVGISINAISLFGMIIVVGILVDDGIVIAESIYQKYEQGVSALDAAIEGTMEVLPAVASAIVTTVIAFSAFFFLDGRLGDFFSNMAAVVIFSLVFSLLEGAFILPAHIAHSKSLHTGGIKNPMNRFFDRVMQGVREKLYRPTLRFAVEYPYLILAFSLAGLFIAFGSVSGGYVKTTFFPAIPRDNFSIDLKLPSGTREDITYRLLDSIQQVGMQINEEMSQEYFGGIYKPMTKFQLNIGPGINQGNIQVTLLDGETRGDLTAREIMNRYRDRLGPIHEAETFTFFAGSPFGKPLSISLLGKDKEELSEAVQAVKLGLAGIPDLKDVVDNNQEGLKEINVRLKPEAYTYGFSIQEVLQQVRQGFFGAEVQRLQRGKDEVKVWVRYENEDRSDLQNLADMYIRNASGVSIPLSQIADFEIARGVISIYHIDGQREVRIEADIASDKVSISDITTDVKSVLLPKILKDFPSVKVGFEGQDREQAKTRTSLQKVMPLVFLLMFFSVILTFNSVSQSILLFGIIPFGLIGVILGHFVIDLPISFFSVLGMIALIGVMVNDGLVFITAFNDQIKNGVHHREAIMASGLSRFRPIILTSVTTIAGLAPLVLEKSFQAQFLIPMAVSVAFGLLVSTFLLLVQVPALLVIFNDLKVFALSQWRGAVVYPNEVEPADPNRTQNLPLFILMAVIALGGMVGLIMVSFKVASALIGG